jgi:hypothetical protein
MQTRSQTLIQNSKPWVSDIQHQLEEFKQATSKIEKFRIVINMYEKINKAINDDDSVFIKVRCYAILSITMFMKLFELRTEIQKYQCSNTEERKIVRKVLQTLNMAEENIRTLLKKNKNLSELAILSGYFPSNLEQNLNK